MAVRLPSEWLRVYSAVALHCFTLASSFAYSAHCVSDNISLRVSVMTTLGELAPLLYIDGLQRSYGKVPSSFDGYALSRKQSQGGVS